MPSKRRAVVEVVVGVGLSTAAAAVWIWMTAPTTDTPATVSDQVVQQPATLANRRLEELYFQASVVAQLQVLEVSGLTAVVRPLAVFKADGQPIRFVVAPMVFCAPSFEVGATYLVFAERAAGHVGTVAVLDGRDGDEVGTYMVATSGGQTAPLFDRLQDLSGVRAYTGPIERMADAGNPGSCRPG